jgi:ubiquinone/menaquinone biosynthesis C-methylase UbiE
MVKALMVHWPVQFAYYAVATTEALQRPAVRRFQDRLGAVRICLEKAIPIAEPSSTTQVVNAGSSDTSHSSKIQDQFSRQAEGFAASPSLHNADALALLVDAALPSPDDVALDVACGPGSVVAAFAARVRRAVGLDATEAMLAQARQLAAARSLSNTEFRRGDVYALPFAAESFDIVSCRFAFHHFEEPERAFAEMLRVCRRGGRIVLCDGVASDDPAKAAAFNRMESHRDPSTVEFRTLSRLVDLFTTAALPTPAQQFYRVPAERERLIAGSFPANNGRDLLRRMIDESVDGDLFGMEARRDGDTVPLSYSSVVLTSRKP